MAENTQGIVIVNFSHPITDAQRTQVESLAGNPVSRVCDVAVDMHVDQAVLPQTVSWVDQVELSPHDWQTLPIVVNLPGLAIAAGCLLAELHGRLGHFPTVMRIRPVGGSVPVRYEVAELIDLQRARDDARARRFA